MPNRGGRRRGRSGLALLFGVVLIVVLVVIVVQRQSERTPPPPGQPSSGQQPGTTATQPPPKARTVLLVPGWAEPQDAFAPMRDLLGKRGIPSEIMAFGPRNLSVNITSNARAVKSKVDQLRAHGGGEVDILAHSMGGLAARAYIQQLGGASSVANYVSVGTPQLGADPNDKAFGYCNIVRELDVCAGSRFVRKLNANPPPPGVSYWTVHDSGDFPSTAKPMPGPHCDVTTNGIGHGQQPGSPEIAELLIRMTGANGSCEGIGTQVP